MKNTEKAVVLNEELYETREDAVRNAYFYKLKDDISTITFLETLVKHNCSEKEIILVLEKMVDKLIDSKELKSIFDVMEIHAAYPDLNLIDKWIVRFGDQDTRCSIVDTDNEKFKIVNLNVAHKSALGKKLLELGCYESYQKNEVDQVEETIAHSVILGRTFKSQKGDHKVLEFTTRKRILIPKEYK